MRLLARLSFAWNHGCGRVGSDLQSSAHQSSFFPPQKNKFNPSRSGFNVACVLYKWFRFTSLCMRSVPPNGISSIPNKKRNYLTILPRKVDERGPRNDSNWEECSLLHHIPFSNVDPKCSRRASQLGDKSNLRSSTLCWMRIITNATMSKVVLVFRSRSSEAMRCNSHEFLVARSIFFYLGRKDVFT